MEPREKAKLNEVLKKLDDIKKDVYFMDTSGMLKPIKSDLENVIETIKNLLKKS